MKNDYITERELLEKLEQMADTTAKHQRYMLGEVVELRKRLEVLEKETGIA